MLINVRHRGPVYLAIIVEVTLRALLLILLRFMGNGSVTSIDTTTALASSISARLLFRPTSRTSLNEIAEAHEASQISPFLSVHDMVQMSAKARKSNPIRGMSLSHTGQVNSICLSSNLRMTPTISCRVLTGASSSRHIRHYMLSTCTSCAPSA